jgi:hypothetical protein
MVREVAGHSDTEVTMTIYAHVSLEEKCKALGKLGEVRSADAVAVKRGASSGPGPDGHAAGRTPWQS